MAEVEIDHHSYCRNKGLMTHEILFYTFPFCSVILGCALRALLRAFM